MLDDFPLGRRPFDALFLGRLVFIRTTDRKRSRCEPERVVFEMALYCKNFRAILTANDGNNNMLVTRTRCKQWDCDYCMMVNRKQWRKRIFDAGETLGDAWAFCTLTAHSKKRGAEKSLENLQAAWSPLRKRMKREWGKFAYVRVYEMHKDGSYHWHMLVNFHFSDLKQRKQKDGKLVWYSPLLKRMAQDCGLGYYTHAENMNTLAGAVNYVTKYMTKSMAGLPKNIRRVQTSQGFPKLENENEYEWMMKAGIFERDVWHQIGQGGDIIDISTGDPIEPEYFQGENWVWPIEFHDIE